MEFEIKYDVEKIKKQYQAGQKMKFLFFWGHKKDLNNKITNSCLSQWYAQSFIINEIEYPTAEHYMMAQKARLFKDKNALENILSSSSPANAKKVGREVLNFDKEIWEKHRLDIVIKGNYAKFSQNSELREFLIKTNKKILVEASPYDKIWGIGLDYQNEFAKIPVKWQGLNLLGFALMEVRDLLLKS